MVAPDDLNENSDEQPRRQYVPPTRKWKFERAIILLEFVLWILTGISLVTTYLTLGPTWYIFANVAVLALFTKAMQESFFRRPHLPWALGGSVLGLAGLIALSGQMIGLETGYFAYGVGFVIFEVALLRAD